MNNLRPIFHRNHDFYSLSYCYWLEWRRWPHLTFDTASWPFKGQVQWPRLSHLCLPVVTKLMSYGLLEALGLNVCVVIHTYLFPGSLDRFLSIRAADTARLQAIFSGEDDIVLFGNAIRHNYSIKLTKNVFMDRNERRTLQWSFTSLRSNSFEIWSPEIGKSPTSRKFGLCLLVTWPNVHLCTW